MREATISPEKRMEVIKKALEILKDQLTMEEYLIFLQTITKIGEPHKTLKIENEIEGFSEEGYSE